MNNVASDSDSRTLQIIPLQCNLDDHFLANRSAFNKKVLSRVARWNGLRLDLPVLLRGGAARLALAECFYSALFAAMMSWNWNF